MNLTSPSSPALATVTLRPYATTPPGYDGPSTPPAQELEVVSSGERTVFTGTKDAARVAAIDLSATLRSAVAVLQAKDGFELVAASVRNNGLTPLSLDHPGVIQDFRHGAPDLSMIVDRGAFVDFDANGVGAFHDFD